MVASDLYTPWSLDPIHDRRELGQPSSGTRTVNEPVSRSAWSVEPGQWQGARSYQEDDYGYEQVALGTAGETPAVFMVLADGMGGEAGGATASRCVVEAFMHRIREPEGGTETWLDACLDSANRDIRTRGDADPDLEGMGSTVVAAVYDGHSVWWLSVGDSPMWLFTGGRLVRLNADHSMAPVLDRMAEVGEITREEALSDGTRHMLRSAVTGSELDLIDRGYRPCRLGEGDFLLLASDGIETLSQDEIELCLGSARRGSRATADSLLSAVKAAAKPHQDNVTFLLLAGEGHTAHRTEQSNRATEKVTRPFWQAAHRSAVVALFLGVALLLGGLMWWGLREPPEVMPELGNAATSEPPAESMSEDSPSQSEQGKQEGETPESTGRQESAVDSDSKAPESGGPDAEPGRESSTSDPKPRPDESSEGDISGSAASDGGTRPEKSPGEPVPEPSAPAPRPRQKESADGSTGAASSGEPSADE